MAKVPTAWLGTLAGPEFKQALRPILAEAGAIAQWQTAVDSRRQQPFQPRQKTTLS
jgi:hypothetical protein